MEIPKALVTGGSRGVGAATAVSLAERGFDVAIGYREKRARAERVVDQVRSLGRQAIALGGDITIDAERDKLVDELGSWTSSLKALVLNASGGLEVKRLQEDPDYPTRINHDAQLAILDSTEPLLAAGSTVAFITSHWAHLYGQVEHLPSYGPVAASKHLGEMALRGRQTDLAASDVRLIVITGDLVEGTITSKLLERQQPGLAETRRAPDGRLVNTDDMGRAIASSIVDASLPTGHTIVVGAPLESLI